METTQTKVLKALKTNGRISSTKDTPEEESVIIDKLEAFGLIQNHRKYSYKPTQRFHQFSEELIATQTPIENFQFKEDKISHNTYNTTINAERIGQFAQGSGIFHFDQINVDAIQRTLEEVLNPDQLNEIKEIINKKDGNHLFSKLKSFGSDVLASVVSGILTSPGIYS
ncbi:hypothetical protein [Salegentibacter sp. T436]|uniref:hypothetical protein n=1 Tax=Salegentibacter sp. T436 TaxID=1729720 RepID=UPI00094A294B|nr:hypothetical protein [Salegentibacter sp. T436]APS40477.1 hypothetical protein AO058_17055 [Salegentibacter sp. T436]